MSLASHIVEVGFTSPSTGEYLHLNDSQRGIIGTNLIAPNDLWVDVSQWVESIPQARRGATRADGPVLRYEAGTATIILRNEDRRFDPTNLAGPYVAGGVTQVEPMRKVRIRATWDGVTYPLWWGFADDWQVVYTGPNTSHVVLTCSDAFSLFASHDRDAVAAVGAGEGTGQRIARILDSVDWSATDRVFDSGNVTVQSTTLADNTLTELLLTSDSELGEFWMDAKGRTRFRNRVSIQDDVRSALANGCFGDQPADGVSTTVNLATNPSLERDTAGWSAAGSVPPTPSRSNTRAKFGTWSLLATWGTGGFLPNINYDVAGLTVGRTYTISVYVWVPSGSPDVAVIVAGTNTFGTETSVKDDWVRLSWTGTASATTWGFQIWPNSAPTAGQQVYIDALQVEEGRTATAYVDGDQADCEWDGLSHASTSRRLPELPYTDAVLTSDVQSMANLISIANAGGTAQVVENAGSRTAYLTRTFQRHDLLMQSNAAALMYAEQLIARTASPELRFSSLVLNPQRDPDCLWPQALGREIGDRIRVIRRPPGGGAAIERECFVRGIEHELNSDLRWTTRFALQAAPAITTVIDTFFRTASNGWGTADSGHPWTVDGTAAQFSVSSSVGLHTVNARNTTFRSRTSGLSVASVDLRLAALLNTAPTGDYVRHEPAVRILNASNYYGLQVHVQPGGAVDLQLVKVVAGAPTTLTAISSGITHTAGISLEIRFQAVGTTLRARVWRAVDPEPTTWQITTTDSTFTSGDIGVGTLLPPSNTNVLPYSVIYDNVTARSLYAWY